MSTKPKYVVRGGNVLEVDPQVVRWQKRRRTFEANKNGIIVMAYSHFEGDEARIEKWFRTPQAELGQAPPKQFLNPKDSKELLRWARKHFKALSKGRGTP